MEKNEIVIEGITSKQVEAFLDDTIQLAWTSLDSYHILRCLFGIGAYRSTHLNLEDVRTEFGPAKVERAFWEVSAYGRGFRG